MKIEGNIVDVFREEIYPGEVIIQNGKISDIIRTDNLYSSYILPGFIDSHIHIESSMLSPVSFSKEVIRHGTVGVINDPHEIANVCGIEGIQYMVNESRHTPLKIFFGAPSCVPASAFETSGSSITSNEISLLLQNEEFYALSEMMNFPGVIYEDPEVYEKIKIAKSFGKPIDGHAPGLTGENLKKYVSAGISTDHECFTLTEAKEKISLGMKILIREGSAARNFETLYSLIDEYPDMIMFCSDDKHPDDLIQSHINLIVIDALQKGCKIFNVLKAACLNPVIHYNLPVGMLQINDAADFIIVKNLTDLNIQHVFINGIELFNQNTGLNNQYFKSNPASINQFYANKISFSDLICFPDSSHKFINIIEVFDGEIVTRTIQFHFKNSFFTEFIHENQFNKIVLINRYSAELKPVIGYVKGFMFQGAIASTIAHDSHNIIAIGNSDKDLCKAINQVISYKGGITYVKDNTVEFLPLEIAGLMTNKDAIEVATQYQKLDRRVKEAGCNLRAPFMTLSFLALIVIPELKISDKGLFDISRLSYVSLFE